MQGTLGFFNGNVGFDEIVVAANSSIINGELNVSSNSGFRGIGITIDPMTLLGAGTYQVEFDITSYSGDANDFAEVSVWSGSGYEFGNDANALSLNAQTGELTGLGSAVATELTTETYTSAGAQSFTFEYDGTSAVALFFGTTTGGFPFPEVTFDNITVSTIPEPSSFYLLAIGSVFCFSVRRRAKYTK